jgi:hypothetical protein
MKRVDVTLPKGGIDLLGRNKLFGIPKDVDVGIDARAQSGFHAAGVFIKMRARAVFVNAPVLQKGIRQNTK